MCGRYTLTSDTQKLSKKFAAQGGPSLFGRYNIAPTQPVPVVRAFAENGSRRIDLVRWGLVPSWAEDPAIGNRLINARSETAAAKPAYRAAFKYHRCLVPADGFYEWQKIAEGRKQAHLIRMADGEPFAFAGLWERWQDEHGNELESCAILTTEANEMMAKIHDRMPVILDEADYASWLDLEPKQPGDAQGLLRPFPAELMMHHSVSTHVNNPKHDDPSCVKALSRSG